MTSASLQRLPRGTDFIVDAVSTMEDMGWIQTDAAGQQACAASRLYN